MSNQEEKLVRLMYPVEGGALRLTEGGAASLAPVAPLFLAMDHDVSLPRSPEGPTVLVVAELLSRVHGALLLLTLYTSKDAPEIRFSFNSPSHTRLRGVLATLVSRQKIGASRTARSLVPTHTWSR